MAEIDTILAESRVRDDKGRFTSAPPAETPQEAATPVEPVAAPTTPEKTTPVVEPAAAAAPAPAVVSASEEAYKKAMREEREKRQRVEAENRELREKATPPKDPWQDLPGYLSDQERRQDERLFVERCNLTEEIAREKHKDYEVALEAFKEAGESNPNLYVQLRQERNPAEFVYREGIRIKELKDVGGDFTAYRSKLEKDIEARVRAELEAKYKGVAPSVPASLNSDSSPPVADASYQGPKPLSAILPTKF